MNTSLFLELLKEYGEKHKIPNISETNAHFLQNLIRIKKAKSILEIGTANGYSTIHLALATKIFGGKVTTIEFSEASQKNALENFKKVGVNECIISYLGNALDIIPTLNGKYDFIFIDGMKKRSLDFYLLCLKKAKKGAVIIIDDVIKYKHKMGNLYEYFDSTHTTYNVLPIDIDDGIMMLIKD